MGKPNRVVAISDWPTVLLRDCHNTFSRAFFPPKLTDDRFCLELRRFRRQSLDLYPRSEGVAIRDFQ